MHLDPSILFATIASPARPARARSADRSADRDADSAFPEDMSDDELADALRLVSWNAHDLRHCILRRRQGAATRSAAAG